MTPCRVSPENPAKSIETLGCSKARSMCGRSANGAGGPLADEHPAALPGDDQALVAQQADRLLDGHPGHAVALGEFVA